ncbi:MAG: nucleoside-diphosphate sugar epimerase [Proteobacteria bacterium]|nr:nucleoside-diphosphate sugar epimerase [Pseudomonadota bacterium]
MSEPAPIRICLVGASGLTGQALIRACIGRSDVRLQAVARAEVPLPPGARMEVLVAPTDGWRDAIAATRPQVLVCALGTTRAKAGSEAAFRAVDHDLVLAAARAGVEAGARQLILISSTMADASSKTFYLRLKGEVEAAVGRLGYQRVDLIRPGLLRGPRAERRVLERLAQVASPLVDLALNGQYRRYRSVPVDLLARAILGLAHERAAGRFIHEYDAILRAAARLQG